MKKINRTRKIGRLITAAILLLCSAAILPAGSVRLAFHDTTTVGGTQLDYPIYADSSLTGLGVLSYECEFTYNTSDLTFLGTSGAGTLTAGWSSPIVNEISPGRIRLAAAGSTSLSGIGKMLILRFAMQGRTYSTYTYVSFQTALLNEGTPTVTTRNGYVLMTAIPSIAIAPDTWKGTRGDSTQFTVSGGKAPYTWSTTIPAVASISSTGRLAALSVGTTKVVCTDSAGVVDTSGVVEVRGMKLSFRDTSRYQGQMLDLPIYVTSLAGLNIVSGEITINFNSSFVTPVGTVEAGTVLASYGATTMMVGSGTVKLSFAGTSPLSGSGILLYLRLKASTTNHGGSTFSFANVFFNESLPANTQDASVNILQLPTISVSPSSATTMIAGDSAQFTATGGTPPYVWMTSDTLCASISSGGWLKGKSGGTVVAKVQDAMGATGQSGTISVYDFRLSIPDTSFLPASAIEIPVYVTPNMKGFESFAMRVNFPIVAAVQCTGVVTAGTLSEGFSLASYQSSGSVKIAAAIGSGKIAAGGVLLKLRFTIADTMVIPPRMTLTLTEVVFNEGSPLSLNDDGYFDITNRSVFKITPLSAFFSVPTVGKKDSAIFVIRNGGTANLTSSAAIDWPGSTEFTVQPPAINVSPADSVKIKVYYQPVNLGIDTAYLRLITNDPLRPNVALQLVGRVIVVPAISLNISTFAFGNVQVGKRKDTTVTLSNPGTDTLKITSISANDAAFTAYPAVIKIPPGQSFVDTLRFAPTLVVPIQGRFLILSNAATSPDTIRFSGTGTPAMGVDRMGRIPDQFSLEQNFPNPFNPSTTIWYSVPTTCKVKIQICDVLGQAIADLVDGDQSPGWRSVVWNARTASGMYFYRIEAASTDGSNKRFVQVKKMLLMK